MEARLFKGIGSAERLTALEIDPEWLREPMKASELERDSCGPLIPPTGPGLRAWLRRNERLRELVLPHGWRMVNSWNMPMVESPDGQIAIVCIGGDEQTGIEGVHPKTKRNRGPVTEGAISDNWEQLSLLPQLPGFIEQRQQLRNPFTYVLLSHRAGPIVRCELSLPFSMDDKMRVSGWSERILLAPVELEPQILMPDAAPSPKIEIDVSRKNA